MLDRQSGLSVLLDTGACCSIWPRKKFANVTLDENKKLQAVNGTRINTYGNRVIKIKPTKSNLSYWHEVTLADVDQPIFGWSFMTQFKLDLKWDRKGGCFLSDRTNVIPLKMDTYNALDLNLALVSFKEFAQQRTPSSL